MDARERRARPQVVETRLQDLAGQEWQPSQIVEGPDVPGLERPLVEQSPAIGDLVLDELQEPAEATQAILFQPVGRQPLGRLQLPQEPKGGLPLDSLVEREEITPDKSLVHDDLFRAWLSSSSACSTESVQSKERARWTSAAPIPGRLERPLTAWPAPAIAVGHQKPIPAIPDDLGGAADPRRHAGRAAGERLEEDVRPAFRLRREHGHVGRAEPAGQLGMRAGPRHVHVVLQPETPDGLDQPPPILLAGPRTADHDVEQVGILPSRLGRISTTACWPLPS